MDPKFPRLHNFGGRADTGNKGLFGGNVAALESPFDISCQGP
jgi:hypothetical protein